MTLLFNVATSCHTASMLPGKALQRWAFSFPKAACWCLVLGDFHQLGYVVFPLPPFAGVADTLTLTATWPPFALSHKTLTTLRLWFM